MMSQRYFSFFYWCYSHKSIKPTCFPNNIVIILYLYIFRQSVYFFCVRVSMRTKICRPLSCYLPSCWRTKIIIIKCTSVFCVWISDEKYSIIMSLLTDSEQYVQRVHYLFYCCSNKCYFNIRRSNCYKIRCFIKSFRHDDKDRVLNNKQTNKNKQL